MSSKSVLLDGEALKLALEVIDATTHLERRLSQLQAQAEQAHEDFKAENDRIWTKLSARLKLDPAVYYYLDVQYYDDHGLMFLIPRQDQRESQLLAMSAPSTKVN